MIGRNTCYKHGGSTPRGHELPQTTHGLYSKSLPTRLAARYQQALADPELLGMKRETALIASLLDDALQRLDSGETGELWLALQKKWAEMLDAAPLDRAPMLNEIGFMIQRGASDSVAAREIRAVILDKAKVAESERKRLVEAHQVITVERLMALVGALSAAIIEEVGDVATRGRVIARFERLLSAGVEEKAS